MLPYSVQSRAKVDYSEEAVLMTLTRDLRLNPKLNLKLVIGAMVCSLLRVRRYSAIVALIALWLSAAPSILADTLITNARIIDGTGTPAIAGSVRLSGDRITAVGKLTPHESDAVIDASGLVLAPGFIDTHSHSDRLILTERDALAKITHHRGGGTGWRRAVSAGGFLCGA
jgi:hypothetical protein